MQYTVCAKLYLKLDFYKYLQYIQSFLQIESDKKLNY